MPMKAWLDQFDQPLRTLVTTAVFVVGLAVVISTLAAIAILMYHYLSPSTSHWLDCDQMADLQSVMGALGGGIVTYLIYSRRRSNDGR